MPNIYFGNAHAEYPKGYPHDFRHYGVMRRRPEEDGADAIKFGHAPRPWSTQCVVFGSTGVLLNAEIAKWTAAVVSKETLILDDPGAGQFAGVLLTSVDINWGPRRIFNASNGANWAAGLTLVFARISET